MSGEPNPTLQRLRELAQNLWWSWQPDIRAIFRELDPATWSVVYHNPVASSSECRLFEVSAKPGQGHLAA